MYDAHYVLATLIKSKEGLESHSYYDVQFVSLHANISYRATR